MSDAVTFALATCVACGGVFACDPDLVPSVAVVIGTGRHPKRPLQTRGVHVEGVTTREPICPRCATRINVERARLGLELIPEHDTAEALIRSVGRYGP